MKFTAISQKLDNRVKYLRQEIFQEEVLCSPLEGNGFTVNLDKIVQLYLDCKITLLISWHQKNSEKE